MTRDRGSGNQLRGGSFFFFRIIQIDCSAREDESFGRRDDPVHPAGGPAVGNGVHQARLASSQVWI